MSDLADNSSEVALKFLEHARAEILERIKFGNQLPVVYLGAVAALSAWAWSNGDAQHRMLSFTQVVAPLAAATSFLALATSWLLTENEAMVNALAEYQREQLAIHLKHCPPLWECSEELRNSEKIWGGTLLIQILVIVIWPTALFLFAWHALAKTPPDEWQMARHVCVATAAGLICAAALTCGRMMKHRSSMRKKTLQHKANQELTKIGS